MDWKKKTCIAATMFLLSGADAIVMPQEVAAAQIQDKEQDFSQGEETSPWESFQKGMEEVKALLKQGKNVEAKTKWRNLKEEYEHKTKMLNMKVFYAIADIYRFEGMHQEEIDILKEAYEANLNFFTVRVTPSFLGPITALCEAYQVAGDFSSAEPYLKHGEEILREREIDFWSEELADFRSDKLLFQKAALFYRMGQGKLTPDEVQKEAAKILGTIQVSNGHWKQEEQEVLDIFYAAAASPQTFSDEVDSVRHSGHAMMIFPNIDRVEKMNFLAQAAYNCTVVFGEGDAADQILEPVYYEIKKEYKNTKTQQEAEAMLSILCAQGIRSSFGGDYAKAIEANDMAWELYEETSKKRNVQDMMITLFTVTAQSYQAMNEQEKLNAIAERTLKISNSGSFVSCYGKVLKLFCIDKKAGEEEKRQALADLRAAADKECAEDPNRVSAIHTVMMLVADMLPKRWASVIQSGKDVLADKNEQSFGEQSVVSHLALFTEAEKTFQEKDYLKAIPLYERLLKMILKTGNVYGSMCMTSLRNCALSYYVLGWQAQEGGNKESAKKLMDRSLELYDTFIDIHEYHRKEQFDGLSPEERGKWFSNVVDDYMDTVRRFCDGSIISSKKIYYERKMFDTLEKCKARILLERYARQNNTSPKILTCEEGQELLSRMTSETAFFEYVMRRSDDYSRESDMLDFYSLTKTDLRDIGYGSWTYWDEWFAYYKLLSYPDYESFSRVYWLWKKDKQGHAEEHYVVTEKGGNVEGGHLIDSSDDLVNARNFANARKELAEKWGKLFDFNFTNNLRIRHGMKIIISPDDAVPLLPFETLTCDGKPLAELYEISYAPSLSVYALMQEHGETNTVLADRKELFAMGNAIYDYTEDVNVEKARGGSFKELPETATELNQVGELFQEEKRTILQQEDASEPLLKSYDESGELAQYKYLLFAAHGTFEEENPLANAIVLSQPDKRKPAAYDGYVTVGEWMRYKLHSDLTYLSACNSGRGAKYAGEGLIGLPYALTLAGNKSTVMTLWEIGDDAAAAFSTAFFTRLTEGQDASQALAETKREFLHHEIAAYRDPHVWGAFQLYGE